MNIPIFFIDTCYNPYDYVTETRVRYVRAQIDQLIEDLCKFTGKKWDEERFQKIMKISQKNSYLWERANNLLDRKPSPLKRIRTVQLYGLYGLQPRKRVDDSDPAAAE
ncbi:MAG: 2-hydroxyacyl-CoA dehydratase [Clostridiaceae bacterium]